MSEAEKPFNISGFIRENIVWLLGLLPFLLAGLRILTVSEGHTEVLLELLLNLNLVQLMLATIIPLLPLMLFWAFFVAWNSKRAVLYESPHWVRGVLITVVAFVVLSLNAVWLAISLAVIIWEWTKLRRSVGRMKSKYGADFQDYSDVRGIDVPDVVTLSVVFAFIVSNSIWLPTQAISVKDGKPFTAYVLSADDQWTTTINDDRRIVTFRTPDIESISVCAAPDAPWWDVPLIVMVLRPGARESPNDRCPT